MPSKYAKQANDGRRVENPVGVGADFIFFFVLGYTKGGVSEVRECLSVGGRNSATSLGNKSEKTLGDEDFSEYDH